MSDYLKIPLDSKSQMQTECYIEIEFDYIDDFIFLDGLEIYHDKHIVQIDCDNLPLRIMNGIRDEVHYQLSKMENE